MMALVGASHCSAMVSDNRNLRSLGGQLATLEQETAFLNRGQKMVLNCIEYFILKCPSAQVPQRQATLLTFASGKIIQKKIKQLDREKKRLPDVFVDH